jgi:hypothetical protein
VRVLFQATQPATAATTTASAITIHTQAGMRHSLPSHSGRALS